MGGAVLAVVLGALHLRPGLPHVCVVVPTYNRAFCLPKALDAAPGQSPTA